MCNIPDPVGWCIPLLAEHACTPYAAWPPRVLTFSIAIWLVRGPGVISDVGIPPSGRALRRAAIEPRSSSCAMQWVLTRRVDGDPGRQTATIARLAQCCLQWGHSAHDGIRQGLGAGDCATALGLSHGDKVCSHGVGDPSASVCARCHCLRDEQRRTVGEMRGRLASVYGSAWTKTRRVFGSANWRSSEKRVNM